MHFYLKRIRNSYIAKQVLQNQRREARCEAPRLSSLVWICSRYLLSWYNFSDRINHSLIFTSGWLQTKG